MSDVLTTTEVRVSSEKPDQKGLTRERVWTSTEKTAFRIAFIYILLLCIPTYSSFYAHLFGLQWGKITYHDFQSVVAFWPPQIVLIESEEGVFGLLNYINLILVFVIAVAAGLAWGVLDRKRINYSKLYYWIRVLARYRLAYGMVGWGLKKAFPMQMVYPTEGMLNTPFIDFAEKKLYWSHVGVSFEYTVFLGFAEIIPGLLLLHRKTSVLGAALAAVVTFNICIANHAYDAGVAVPAAYFAILGIFIAWYDLPYIWKLLVNEKDVAVPYRYNPVFPERWQRNLRNGLKIGFNFIFVPLAAFAWGWGFFNGNNYNIPSTPGLADTRGYYNVSEFKLNGKVIPYSPQDSLRWQDAIFEDWSTLSYKANRGAIADRMIGYSPLRVKQSKNKVLNDGNSQNSDMLQKANRNRDMGVTRWEVGGMAGDRRYFFYKADTVNKVLYLKNKNRNHNDEAQVLHYERPTPTRIILSGRNEFNDSINVVLDKSDKKYPLIEGRRTNIASF